MGKIMNMKKLSLIICLCIFNSTFAAEVLLENLELQNMTTGWGTVRAGKSIMGTPITINGVVYNNGVGTHAVSQAFIKMDSNAVNFSAYVGMDDEVIGGSDGSIRFVVKANGIIKFDSGIMKPGSAAKQISIDLTGCKILSLEVTDAGDNNWSDHADWANAKITYNGQRPQMITSNEAINVLNDLYYTAPANRTNSPGNTTYYVNPNTGNDTADGKSANNAWKTLMPLNKINLKTGDKVKLFPGEYKYSLHLSGSGTEAQPIIVHFAPGNYNFISDIAIRRNYHFSNANDAPYRPKEVALCFENVNNYKIEGSGAVIIINGRMVETVLDHCRNFTVTGLEYRYDRPTVSEFKTVAFGDKWAEIEINKECDYKIENGQLFWVEREGNLIAWQAVQIYDPASGYLYRDWGDHFSNITSAVEISPYRVRLNCSSQPRLKPNVIYQTREWPRYYVGHFIRQSKDVTFKDIKVDFMHGLGFLNEFSENLTYDNVDVIPRKESGRTCSAWCDALHFSGCKGQIRVKDCIFSGVNDDPINVHGTHLRIIAKPADDKIKVRFMHALTYGIEAFRVGDDIEFVRNTTLIAYGTNRVKAVEKLNDYELLLTLENPAPTNIVTNADAIENITWTPDVHISGCTVELDSTRGFLVTSRGKVIIEDCKFIKTSMAAILIANDAGSTANPENSWFESGPVRDVIIRNNKFIKCAEPVIYIEPENVSFAGPVHKNISILNNEFELSKQYDIAVSAKSTQGLTITGNTFKTAEKKSSVNDLIQLNHCENVLIENNRMEPVPILNSSFESPVRSFGGYTQGSYSVGSSPAPG